MANIKYFSDITGQATELKGLHQMDNAKFAALWPGIKGIRADGYTKWVAHTATGVDAVLPVTRMIEMKRFPTKHECNAKCLNGKHNGACECQCGGKNHGRGMFTQLLADRNAQQLDPSRVCPGWWFGHSAKEIHATRKRLCGK